MPRTEVIAEGEPVYVTRTQIEALGLLAENFTLYRTRWSIPQKSGKGPLLEDKDGKTKLMAKWWLEADNGDRVTYRHDAMMNLVDMGLVRADPNPPVPGYRVNRYPYHLTAKGSSAAQLLAGMPRTDEGVHYE